MEDVGIFYGHLVYYTSIWSTLLSLGIFYSYLVHFFTFWYVEPRKIWQPWLIATVQIAIPTTCDHCATAVLISMPECEHLRHREFSPSWQIRFFVAPRINSLMECRNADLPPAPSSHHRQRSLELMVREIESFSGRYRVTVIPIGKFLQQEI
jgi:hypothetical protein